MALELYFPKPPLAKVIGLLPSKRLEEEEEGEGEGKGSVGPASAREQHLLSVTQH